MAWRKGTLELDKKKRLDDIGFVWEAGTNGSGSDELREYEALHASNRIKAELAESQSNLLAELPGGFDGGHYEGSESAAQRDPAEGDAPAAGGRGESAERSCVTGEAPVPREESRERSRDDTVTRRGRLKLEEAKSFDDWCALLQQVRRRWFKTVRNDIERFSFSFSSLADGGAALSSRTNTVIATSRGATLVRTRDWRTGPRGNEHRGVRAVSRRRRLTSKLLSAPSTYLACTQVPTHARD